MPRLIQRILNREPIDISIHASCPLINPQHIDDLCDQLSAIVLGRAEGMHVLGGSEIVSIQDITRMAGRILSIEPVFNQVDGAKSSMYCKGRGAVSLESGLGRLIDSIRGGQ